MRSAIARRERVPLSTLTATILATSARAVSEKHPSQKTRLAIHSSCSRLGDLPTPLHRRKDVKQAAAIADASDHDNSAEAKFLRLAVHGACSIFSTVLGPEANDVHRTHFHLDLQDRGSVDVCK